MEFDIGLKKEGVKMECEYICSDLNCSERCNNCAERRGD